MEYHGNVAGREARLRIEKQGVYLGERLLDYADVAALRPINHRVLIETIAGETIEISMLGFAYDGFWDELTRCFGARSLEALFVEEAQLMLCEGEYTTPEDSGRGLIALYADSVCILPQNCHAVRIALCFTETICLNGYNITITMLSGAQYTIGKMGYDTAPFYERMQKAAATVKQTRQALLEKATLTAPFTHKGLLRTRQSEQYWNAALTQSTCALELFTGEDTATYLYRFTEPAEQFLLNLREATEAMGIHREIIFLPEEKIAANPLYCMAVVRSQAVRFLRARSCGRLIHGASHAQRLEEYLNK